MFKQHTKFDVLRRMQKRKAARILQPFEKQNLRVYVVFCVCMVLLGFITTGLVIYFYFR